jgi:hypothetical protein
LKKKALAHPRPLEEGNPMRGLLLSLSHFSSILLVSLFVLCTHPLWAQRTSTVEESAVQLPDAPSEAQTRLRLTYKGLPLSFKQNQGQAESWMRFFPDRTGYDRLSVNINAVLSQDTKTAEFWGKNRYFIGSAPTKWMTFAPPLGPVHHETFYGTPWAGSVILRIGDQAKAHPHITSLLKTVHPRF